MNKNTTTDWETPCYIEIRTFSYRVYEVSPEYRRGKVLRTYKDKKRAINCMNKSIFRFIKEIPTIELRRIEDVLR